VFSGCCSCRGGWQTSHWVCNNHNIGRNVAFRHCHMWTHKSLHYSIRMTSHARDCVQMLAFSLRNGCNTECVKITVFTDTVQCCTFYQLTNKLQACQHIPTPNCSYHFWCYGAVNIVPWQVSISGALTVRESTPWKRNAWTNRYMRGTCTVIEQSAVSHTNMVTELFGLLHTDTELNPFVIRTAWHIKGTQRKWPIKILWRERQRFKNILRALTRVNVTRRATFYQIRLYLY
jgi:hypothetical protein